MEEYFRNAYAQVPYLEFKGPFWFQIDSGDGIDRCLYTYDLSWLDLEYEFVRYTKKSIVPILKIKE